MADKIDQLKIGSTSYDIDLPPDATPRINTLTTTGDVTIGGDLTIDNESVLRLDDGTGTYQQAIQLSGNRITFTPVEDGSEWSTSYIDGESQEIGFNGFATLSFNGTSGGTLYLPSISSGSAMLATESYVQANPSSTTTTLTGIKIGSTSYNLSLPGFVVMDAPSSNVLTSTQMDTITDNNVVIRGTFLGLSNPILLKPKQKGSGSGMQFVYDGIALGQNTLLSYELNTIAAIGEDNIKIQGSSTPSKTTAWSIPTTAQESCIKIGNLQIVYGYVPYGNTSTKSFASDHKFDVAPFVMLTPANNSSSGVYGNRYYTTGVTASGFTVSSTASGVHLVYLAIGYKV